MAKKVWDGSISKNTDWGGDASTENLPVSGGSIQKWIKENFDNRIGILYYDTTNNRYLAFADQGTLDQYLENPTLTDLILGTFDAPFNYTAEINLISPSYNAVFSGSTGHYLDYTFDIKNKQGSSTGENVNVTYTFIHNANKKVVTEARRYGESVHFNVDDYLIEGVNTIIIGVTGQTTLAATTVAVTYNIINLSLTDEVDISKVYNLLEGPQSVEVKFTIAGTGTKILEWYLDGDQLDFVKSEDEIIDVITSRSKYIELSNLSSGIHSIQLRAYTIINGEKFYTDTYYREVIVYNGDTTENFIALAANIPSEYGIISSLHFYGAEQYIPYELRFATRKSAEVAIYLGDNLLSTISSTQGRETNYSLTSSVVGELNLRLVVSGSERNIPFNIKKTSLGIEELKTGLVFDFTANGRSNYSVDRDIWAYGSYTGKFEGFNWNSASGWVNNALLINSGAKFSIEYAPLSEDATSKGKTLEFEFSTRNVENDDAIVCTLLGSNGAGVIITASEAKLVSAAGSEVSTKFKAGEINRITFVINKKSGATYKNLAFVYVNGILSGAVNFGSGDNFTTPKKLSFIGSDDAQLELRYMRFYDLALSSENILNNYILYRDTIDQMMEAYYRNDIYAEGTYDFSPDKAQHRLPVMIVTGDIPILEGATSTSTQITVDISYVNEQDPSKSFTMKGAAMRIQGTSSLAYPRKNFRIYTNEIASTIVYDSNGNIIPNKLYSFKDGAQPVDCWCLKADFAESSGTHNTGIARIWNDVMYNAKIQYKNVLGQEVDGYVLRTKAQEAALAAGYPYDVRTTIDGFPILLFYKRYASDENYIFLGKYNFNNDKSTPSVFGFENIPNFDNSRMQCWETKDNGHPLGLFTDISGFDANWSDAYESRYPDTKSPSTIDLKTFSLWVNSVTQSNFLTEKWEHLDVYKVAAYYVYLMRFGAVDQVVKNGFITSEDGEHFYYINYDNDTINGLINTGALKLPPDITRQTIGSDGEYVYAGHDSVLWNKLEADTEFMDIVSVVDSALYSAGLRYDEVLRIFNDDQASKWVERVYNQDAEYKYVMPFVNTATNNLFMLQGSRTSHRSWWIAKRFSLYDSVFMSGNYRDRNISFKCLNNTQPGQQFTIEAGTSMSYGYGVNNGTREVGVVLDKGQTKTFTTNETLNLGDVVKIFAAANLTSVNLSAMESRLAVLDVTASYDPSLGTKLKNLILGGAGQTNTELLSISGLGVLERLQNLNIEGYKGIDSLDLSNQSDFRKLYANNSNLSSVTFAKGAPVDRLELPATMLAIELHELPNLTDENLVLEDIRKVHTLNITGCPNLTKDFQFIQDWYDNKTTSDSGCSLVLENIDWSMSPDDVVSLANWRNSFNSFRLTGVIRLTDITLEQVKIIQQAFGEDCFTSNADLWIKVPDKVFIDGPTTITEGIVQKYKATLLHSNHEGVYSWYIDSGSRTGTSIDKDTGELTVNESGYSDNNITIKVFYIPNKDGNAVENRLTISIKKAIYPTTSNSSISGSASIEEGYSTYTWNTTNTNVNGNMVAEWSVSDELKPYVSIVESDLHSCKILRTKEIDMVDGTISVKLKKLMSGANIITISKNLSILRDDIVCTSTTNPQLMACMYAKGFAANETYFTKGEARLITADDLQPTTNSDSASVFYNYILSTFHEFQYFTSVTQIKSYTFYNSRVVEITLPPSIVTISDQNFDSYLKVLNLNEGLETIGDTDIFASLSAKEIYIPKSVKNIKPICFYQSDNGSHFWNVDPENSVYFSRNGSLYLKDPITLVRAHNSIYNSSYPNAGSDKRNYIDFRLDDDVKVVSEGAFRRMHVKNLDLNKVETLDSRSLENFYLKSGYSNYELVIPETVTKFGEEVLDSTQFSKVTILSNKIYLHDYQTASTLGKMGNLKTLVCACNLGSSGLSDVSGTLEELILLEGVTSLRAKGAYMVMGTTIGGSKLMKLTIPSTLVDTNSINDIGGLSKADDLDVTVNNHPTLRKGSEGEIYTTSGRLIVYRGTNPNYKIPSGITELGDYALYGRKNITSLDLTGISYFGDSALAYCSSLSEANFDSSLETLTLHNNVLGYCTLITQLYIPGNFKSWTSYTSPIGYGLDSLEELEFGEGVTSLKGGSTSSTIVSASKLKKLTLPSTITDITCYLVAGAKGLETLIIKAITAPKTSGSSFGGRSNFWGTNNKNAGTNMLYVPSEATGYDTGDWKNYLLSTSYGGFTLSKTL